MESQERKNLCPALQQLVRVALLVHPTPPRNSLNLTAMHPYSWFCDPRYKGYLIFAYRTLVDRCNGLYHSLYRSRR